MGTQPQTMSTNMFPQGILLNNAGNIKHSEDNWNGQSRLQNNKVFVRFLTPQAGVRALMKILLTYQNGHHLSNIEQIITRFAPPGENNTQAYIDDVVVRMGVPPQFNLDLSNIENLIVLSQCIVIHENGRPPSYSMPSFWYEEKIYHDAAIEALSEE